MSFFESLEKFRRWEQQSQQESDARPRRGFRKFLGSRRRKVQVPGPHESEEEASGTENPGCESPSHSEEQAASLDLVSPMPASGQSDQELAELAAVARTLSEFTLSSPVPRATKEDLVPPEAQVPPPSDAHLFAESAVVGPLVLDSFDPAFSQATSAVPFVELTTSAVPFAEPATSAAVVPFSDLTTSPNPLLAFSAECSLQHETLERLLLEVYASEEAYVLALRQLLVYYIEPLTVHIDCCPAPILVFTSVIKQLLRTHDGFLQLFTDTTRITEVFALIDHTISAFLYEEYLRLYDDVCFLISSASNTFPWTDGWQKYLEATQPSSQQADLLFLLLVQFPISRVTKYKLLVEELYKSIAELHHDPVVLRHMRSIEHKIAMLNANYAAGRRDDVNRRIEALVDFEATSQSFFGKCLLYGVMGAVWVDDVPTIQVVGAFLYKSHLVLALVVHPRTILFAIPLCRASCLAMMDSVGGLFTTYPLCSKVIWETVDQQYEIALIAFTSHEHTTWHDALMSMISEVNGQYAMDFSSASTGVCIQPFISPYNINVNNPMVFNSFLIRCYYRYLMDVDIIVDFCDSLYDDVKILANYYANVDYSAFTLRVPRFERHYTEQQFTSLMHPKVGPRLHRSRSLSSLRINITRWAASGCKKLRRSVG